MNKFLKVLLVAALVTLGVMPPALAVVDPSGDVGTEPTSAGQSIGTYPATIPETRFKSNVRIPNQLILGGTQSLNAHGNPVVTQWSNLPALIFRPDQKNGGALDITIVSATPAAARKYTLPDAGANANFVMLAAAQTTAGQLKRADLSVELYDKFPIYLQECRNNDGTVLDATGGASKFKVVNGGVGVGTLNLTGETANNNTKTDTFCKEVQLLDEYVAGGNIAVDVSCQYATGGAPTLTTKTLTVTCYKQNNDGTATAVPLTGGVITLTSANALTTVTVTTPGTFNPGDRLLFYFQGVLTETASVNTAVQVNGINVKYDVKG